MSNRLFNWFDLRRVSRQTFADVPKSEDELLAWSGTLFQMCSGINSIISEMRSMQLTPGIEDGVYRTLEDSIREIHKVISRHWPEDRFATFLNWLYENVITANIGYIKILSQEEIEELL